MLHYRSFPAYDFRSELLRRSLSKHYSLGELHALYRRSDVKLYIEMLVLSLRFHQHTNKDTVVVLLW